jgi:tetratricopeptide (TPR) repeat protein
MKKTIIRLCIFLFISFTAQAQFLNDSKSKALTVKGLDHLYNFEFEEADETFSPVISQYKNHPVSHLINALRIQWENLPIEENPAALKRYISELNKCIDLSEALYKKPATKVEATFFLLASHGFIALIYNYQKEYMKAAGEAKSAHSYFKEGIKYKNSNPEFLFASGLYNYYREQYPETHPIVKPIVIFFEGGNKKLGLNELELAVRNSIFSRIESATYLTTINIKYESNFRKALSTAAWLHNKYPNNVIFSMKYTECLLLNENYDEAEKLKAVLKTRKERTYQIANYVFEGIINEKKDHDPKTALANYSRAVQLKPDGRYTEEYIGMAYLGMGRIFAKQKETAKAKTYFKKTIEIANNEWVVKEAKSGLSNLK